MNTSKLAHILLIEDNEGDIELTKEAFEEAQIRNHLHIVRDGEAALNFLFKRETYKDAITPNIILLDLNLPRLNGQEILEVIKADDNLKKIPVIILTSSKADQDIAKGYNSYANCYIVKPVNVTKFIDVVQKVNNFWVDIVCLPE